MNVDGFKDLEETLAFLHQCDREITDFISGQSSDDNYSSVLDVPAYQVEHRSTNTTKDRDQFSEDAKEIARIKAKLDIPGRNRSRDLQKLELLQLRVEAAELQEQVDENYSMKRGTRYLSEIWSRQSPLARRADDARLEVWGSLAKKHKRLRRQAEQENQHLRQLVDEQVKTIKTLKKMFQKQVVCKPLPWLSRRFDVNRISESSTENFVLLEQLRDSLGGLLTETDCVLQSNGLSAMSPLSKVNTQSISSTTTHIELIKCELLPFDYRVLGEAFMGKMSSTFSGEEEGKHIPENVVVRTPTLEINDQVKIRYRFTGVKHTEKNRIILIVSGRNTLLEVFGEVLDDIQYQEKTWCVFSEASPGVCLVQLSTSLTLEAKSVLRGRQEFVDKICELLVHVYREMVDLVQRDVELSMLGN